MQTNRITIGGLGDFYLHVGESGGYVLYTPEEYEAVSAADYEADGYGRITFQGRPTGWMLPKALMARAAG